MDEQRADSWLELQELLFVDTWDRTHSPYVALHFATHDEGAPFALIVEPPSFDTRLVNQYAPFSVASGDKLDQANVTERVLFPASTASRAVLPSARLATARRPRRGVSA